MEMNNSLSLLSQRHVEHSPEWMVIGTSSRHGLLCLACGVELLEDHNTPTMKKKFLLGEMGSSFKDSSEVMTEFLISHEKFTWYLVDILFDIVQENNEHLTEKSSDVLLQVCCQLQSDELVYSLLQKVLNKIDASTDSQQCLSVLSLLSKLLDALPALAQTLMEDNVDLLKFLTSELSSPDEIISCLAIKLVTSLIIGPGIPSSDTIITEICRRLFDIITAASSQKIIQSAVGLLRSLTEVPEYVTAIVDVTFSSGHHTFASVMKKVLHTRKESLQISAVQIIGQLLSQSNNLQNLAEKLLDADMAEFLVEQLSTTNQVLLSSIFCSLLLLTESDKFFSKCHSVLGIDAILRAAEQCLAMNYFDALVYGLQLLCVIFEKHPEDQKLMSGPDLFKHSTVLLAKCVQLPESKLLLLGMRCLHNLSRKDYLPVPVDLPCLTLPVNAAVGVIAQFPRPLMRGVKRQHPQRREGDKQTSTNYKLAKQEEAILCCVQLIEKAFSIACAISDDASLYEESQFIAPSHEDGCHDNSSLSSYTNHLLGLLEKDIIPTVMINYGIFGEASGKLFISFVRTLCHCCVMDVTVDFVEKLASSSFIQWALEIKSKYYTDSGLCLSVDDFIPSLCTKLLSPSPNPVPTSSLKAAMHHSRGAESLCKLLTEDPDMSIHKSSDQSEASILEIQDGCLAILYCAWIHDDRLVPETSLLEVLILYMAHRSGNRPSDASLKHLLFLVASVSHAGNIAIQMEGAATLLHVIGEAHGPAIYTHNQQIIEWCYTCPGVTTRFASEMLELWVQNLKLRDGDDDEDGEAAEGKEVDFFTGFVSSNQKCLSSLLDLFITISSEETISKIIRILERLFEDSSKNQASLCNLMDDILKKLPQMQAKVLSSNKDVNTPVSSGLVSFLRLVTTVYTSCTDALQVNSSDLKLIFHVVKSLGPPESEETTDIPPDQTLVMLNYLTIILLHSSGSGDSRVASVMLSSESLLSSLQQTITSNQGRRLEVLYTTQKKVRYQSICIIALLVKLCASFKLKPSLLLKIGANVILKSLMDRDLCVKVITIQLLTILLDVGFASPLVHITEGAQQRSRPDIDVGLHLSASTLRSVYFILQNMLLQGSDFLSWNCVMCLSSLQKYVSKRNSHLADHLLKQPWNGFLIQCSLNFHQDSVPPAWLLQLLSLIPAAPSKSLGCLLQSIVQQDIQTQDYRVVAATMNLTSQRRDDITWSTQLTAATRVWLGGARDYIQHSSSNSLVEILYLNDMVLSSDLTTEMNTLPSMERQAEELHEFMSAV